jgi:hypothetical protein
MAPLLLCLNITLISAFATPCKENLDRLIGKRARVVFITDDKTDVTEEIVDWVFPIQQQFKIEDKVHGILPVPTNLERISTEKIRVKTCWTGYDGDVRITDLCAGNCRAIDFYDYLTI